jgi:hypothetical protein
VTPPRTQRLAALFHEAANYAEQQADATEANLNTNPVAAVLHTLLLVAAITVPVAKLCGLFPYPWLLALSPFFLLIAAPFTFFAAVLIAAVRIAVSDDPERRL